MASKNRYVIRGCFDCNGTEKKRYFSKDLEGWVDENTDSTDEVSESVELLKKHGYKLIKEGFHDVERELEDTISRLEDAGVEVISDYGVDGFSIMDTHGEKILVDRANHLEDYHVHYDSCTGDTVKCYELYDYIISNFGRALGLR